MFDEWKLPSFMRMNELNNYKKRNKLFFIKYHNKIIGFYTLDGEEFKNLFIMPEYRRRGIATKIITSVMKKQSITVATTRRRSRIKKLIMKLGFTYTGKEVKGKQSILQIWRSPDIGGNSEIS